jgi:hypothetical protein
MYEERPSHGIRSIVSDAYNALVGAWFAGTEVDHAMKFFNLTMYREYVNEINFDLKKKKNKLSNDEIQEALSTLCELFDADQRFDESIVCTVCVTADAVLTNPKGWLKLDKTFYKNKVSVHIEVICDESRRQCDALLDYYWRNDHSKYEWYTAHFDITGDEMDELTFGEIRDYFLTPGHYVYDINNDLVEMADGFNFYEIRPNLPRDLNKTLNEISPPGSDELSEKTVQEVFKHLNYSPNVLRVIIFACNADDGILM